MKIKVIGRKYTEQAFYSNWDAAKEFPHYEKVAEHTWEIEADTLDAGKKWLAKNHPDMFMGGNVICENGDFTCLAVPCGEYGTGNFETIAARVAYVKKYEADDRWKRFYWDDGDAELIIPEGGANNA